MVEIKNGRGLCMTCNNGPSCFHRARRGPALFCETFDDYVPPVVRTAAKAASRMGNSQVAVRRADEDTSRYTGLCMNCEHRKVCDTSRSATGIWHCENYE